MFPLFSSLRECFPPTSQFSVDDVPDLTGKTVLITGANTGESSTRTCLSAYRRQKTRHWQRNCQSSPVAQCEGLHCRARRGEDGTRYCGPEGYYRTRSALYSM